MKSTKNNSEIFILFLKFFIFITIFLDLNTTSTVWSKQNWVERKTTNFFFLTL